MVNHSINCYKLLAVDKTLASVFLLKVT